MSKPDYRVEYDEEEVCTHIGITGITVTLRVYPTIINQVDNDSVQIKELCCNECDYNNKDSEYLADLVFGAQVLSSRFRRPRGGEKGAYY